MESFYIYFIFFFIVAEPLDEVLVEFRYYLEIMRLFPMALLRWHTQFKTDNIRESLRMSYERDKHHGNIWVWLLHLLNEG